MVFVSDSSGEPLCLISSSVESGAELLKVQYFKVRCNLITYCRDTAGVLSPVRAEHKLPVCLTVFPQADRSGPNFSTIYKNTEQMINVSHTHTISPSTKTQSSYSENTDL